MSEVWISREADERQKVSEEQSGGEGDSKEKKAAQYGGGWAKHAYGDMHTLSNRRQRRQSKHELASGRVRIKNTLKKAKNKPGKPTRKHLLDRMAPIEKNIKRYVDWLMNNEPEMRVPPPGARWTYHCSFRSRLNSLARDLEDRQKLRAEFVRHGYKLP